MLKILIIAAFIVLPLLGCQANNDSNGNPWNQPYSPIFEDINNQISENLMMYISIIPQFEVTEIRLKQGSMSLESTYDKTEFRFTADLFEDTIIKGKNLDLKITGQIKGTYLSNAKYGRNAGYYLEVANIAQGQKFKSEDGSVVVLNEGVIKSYDGVKGVAVDDSTIRHSLFSPDDILLKGPLAFYISNEESEINLHFRSFTIKNDQLLSTGRLLFKLAQGQKVDVTENRFNAYHCLTSKKVNLAEVSSQEQSESEELLPILPGTYDFNECLPATETVFSRPFFINSKISLTKIKYFDPKGIANVGVVHPSITAISVDDFNFKISSPEIKFKTFKEYSTRFPIKEFQISRQQTNFHYNWTDTTPGSTTPRPIDIPVITEGLVSLYGWQPNISTIVEYNPNMRWEGRWTNGTNTYVGVPWKELHHSKVAASYKYCLISYNFGSGFAKYDPNISKYGFSGLDFYKGDDPAKYYCANDMKTMKMVYKEAFDHMNQ